MWGLNMADEESQKKDRRASGSSGSGASGDAGKKSEEAKAEGSAGSGNDMPQPSDTFNRGLKAISKDARPEDFRAANHRIWSTPGQRSKIRFKTLAE